MDQHEIETDFITKNAFNEGKIFHIFENNIYYNILILTLKYVYNVFFFIKGKRVFLPRIVDIPTERHGVLFKSHKRELKMLEVLSQNSIESLTPHGPYKLREPEIDSFDGMYQKYCF